MKITHNLAVLVLVLFSYGHSLPYSGVVSSAKEDLTQDVFKWNDQLDKDSGIIKNHMKENIQAVMSGDPYQAVKTIMKNYIEIAKIVGGHAMYNTSMSAQHLKEDVEKTIASTTSQPESEDPVEPKTEVSDEIETETSEEPEIETSDKVETWASDEPKSETADESDSETSKESEI